MSPTALRRPEKATCRPSGLMAGDSGSSTVVIRKRCRMSVETTSWRTSVFSFSVRTKYAIWSPRGDHDIHDTVFQRPPGVAMYANPIPWSNPLVRLRTTWPSRVDSRTMSSSCSRRLPTIAAIRSPDGAGSIDSTEVYFVFWRLGARFRP